MDAVQFLDEKSAQPSGFTCFDQWEVQSLANFKRKCERDQADLEVFQDQYAKCMSGEMCQDLEFNNKIIYWSSVVMALAIGFVAGMRSN